MATTVPGVDPGSINVGPTNAGPNHLPSTSRFRYLTKTLSLSVTTLITATLYASVASTLRALETRDFQIDKKVSPWAPITLDALSNQLSDPYTALAITTIYVFCLWGVHRANPSSWLKATIPAATITAFATSAEFITKNLTSWKVLPTSFVIGTWQALFGVRTWEMGDAPLAEQDFLTLVANHTGYSPQTISTVPLFSAAIGVIYTLSQSCFASKKGLIISAFLAYLPVFSFTKQGDELCPLIPTAITTVALWSFSKLFKKA